MIKSPLVSIIIDNYNYGRFLKAAIDSALNQTYQPVEVIVVDDGSTDDSPHIIEQYGQRITAIIKENEGQASAFNEGFRVCTGEVIVFLDSDDMLLPTALEQAVAGFDSAQVAKVHWPLWRINGEGQRINGIEPTHSLAEGNLRDQLVQQGPAYFCGTLYGSPTSGNAWSRRFLEQVFPLPEAHFKTGGGDFYMFVIAPVYGQVRRLTEPQGYYRVHGNNDTLKSLEAYMQLFFGWFDQASIALRHHLSVTGIEVDVTTWKRDSWYHKIYTSLQEIDAIVPPKASFMLADDNNWGAGNQIAGRHRVQLMEQNGQYWGPPVDDAMAISEIENQSKSGVKFFFLTWPTFWWIDHYAKLFRYLTLNYKCVITNERLIGFDLRQKQ